MLAFLLLLSFVGLQYAANDVDSKETFGSSPGVNIHFITPDMEQLNLIEKAGFRWIRMDFVWDYVEKEKGVYNFGDYDKLVEELKKRNIRPLFIFDYGNPLYDEGLAPYTEEGRKAFGRFVYESVKCFKYYAKHWEIWNEPNWVFWTPKPNPKDYTALAKEAALRIKEADPEAYVVLGGTAWIDLNFLKECFQYGLLPYLDIVAVHPYRREPPETMNEELSKLRELIREFAPEREVPIWSGEWGYTTVWDGITENRQVQYISRMMLNNFASGIPVSIWYDFKCDGSDPTEGGHNFGIVNFADLSKRPAYRALWALSKLLKGAELVEKLPLGEKAYGLVFSEEWRQITALWMSEGEGKAKISPMEGKFKVYDMFGELKFESRGETTLDISERPIFGWCPLDVWLIF